MKIFDSPSALAQGVADAFLSDVRAALDARGVFSVALAGGTTPKAAYELLASEPRRDLADWTRTQIFFSDERCVPPESPESNYRMALSALLKPARVPGSNVHRMRGEADPNQAAQEYADRIVAMLGNEPRFDLVMLGMGTDGHTASLFPGADPFWKDDSLVRAVYAAKLQAYRLTFTPALINAARHVIIAAEGMAKAPVLAAVTNGPYEPGRYPVQCVKPRDGKLDWFVDRAAASQLGST